VFELGEAEYMQQVQAEAWDWIRNNPARFISLTARRFVNVWVGPIHRPLKDVLGVLALTSLAIVGLWRSLQKITIPQRAALLIPLITYPLIYYLVAYMPRYRIPLDWVLYILAGAAIWQAIRWTLSLLGSGNRASSQ
jgi:hypothetical protein